MKTEHLTLESKLESVDEAEAIVLRKAGECGFDEETCDQIGMAVREVMVNAVVHGNRYNKNKKVHLTIESSHTGLTIEIADEGSGFDVNALADPLSPENLLRQSGRGLLLVRAFMDQVDIELRPEGGMRVRLVKNLQNAEAPLS